MKYLLSPIILLLFLNAHSQSTPVVSETLPQFPGGKTAFLTYVKTQFNYPKSARDAGYSGKTNVTILIKTDGSVEVTKLDDDQMVFRHKEITDSLQTVTSDSLKTQAIQDVKTELTRLFETMPKWEPATKNGKAIKVLVNLPYNMSLY